MTTDTPASAASSASETVDSSGLSGNQISPVLAQVEDEKSAGRALLPALAAKLPLQLDLRVPVPSFRVQNLLALEKGQIVETVWPHTEDLPLWAGDVQLVWSEFEVVDQKLAVRVTRLA
jgi:flagellar motor switch protein FliN/FliY